MTTHRKPLEELIRELPPERQDEVRRFVENLLADCVLTVSSSGAEHDERRELRQCFGAWDSGDEKSADNDLIDFYLAREHDSTHEAER